MKLLRAAHRALRDGRPGGAHDPRRAAERVAGSHCGAVYKAGGTRSFDAVALHPYTGKPRNVVRLAEFARREMRRYRDGRKPIWITELSWPAAKGKTKNTTGFETTDRGQAQPPRRRAPAARPRAQAARIERVFWYTWLSREDSPNSFDYSGPAPRRATAR